MRSEELISKALEKVDNDRYKLSTLIFARVKELSSGSIKPLIEGIDIKSEKLPHIALLEIAEGKIGIDKIENIKQD